MQSVSSPERNLWRPAGAAFAAVVVLASSFGLFGHAIGPYDESALMLGARIVGSGGLPYRDFYTTYGPLGYSLVSPFLGALNPGLAYRTAQFTVSMLIGALLLVGCWLFARDRRFFWAAAGSFSAAAGAAFLQPHFLGFGLTVAALGCFLAARSRPGRRRILGPMACAGALWGLVALVRPPFAIYLGIAMLASIVLIPSEGGRVRDAITLAGSAVVVSALVWLSLYPEITPADFYAASVRIPALLARSSARFEAPRFLGGSAGRTPQLIYFGAALGALHLAAHAWVFALPSRVSRALILLGAAVAAVTPEVMIQTGRPGSAAVAASLSLIVLAGAAIAFSGTEIVRSPALAAAATCGLAADAFLQYMLTRPDPAHFSSSLAFAVAGAGLAMSLPGTRRRLLTAAFVLAGAAPLLFFPVFPFPISKAWEVLTRPARDWPASQFPSDAVRAVRLADSLAAPNSRFVAVASNHRRTDASAVVLFLLSNRPPYTRWWAYDPGIQSSDLVQGQMTGELRHSASSTAVVWDLAAFENRPPGSGDSDPTAFDREVRSLYPAVIGRFGMFEVRRRGSAGSLTQRDNQ